MCHFECQIEGVAIIRTQNYLKFSVLGSSLEAVASFVVNKVGYVFAGWERLFLNIVKVLPAVMHGTTAENTVCSPI